ncbi:bifunctional cobalt-precorrin-7 (C(5))-methyltransferase/cobalt-precorrin-6B (C(15))-methyltransferase [Bosea sp. LC85]|uniref:bifunctional cobalt-precorrin-7 (C(5))-methyltransferase/cobalt-precorrin-6B (C(15))-methyltransferase n=1 Tax=Bosea sp. LC85 TaxID=1502851 RepID=UPI0006977DA0|nr:bifunctional cobalt-precorrin-7 (C(5))-methyltransferase/cobalt-precorrin-6B (C(15))-methyltransferase [Bosea sp. LC85]
MTLFSPESDELSRASAPATEPWLCLVGLGEDGRAGLSQDALAALEGAELVYGGARHIALIGPVSGEAAPWPQPFRNALPLILSQRGRKVCVLASGDPFHYGIGASLAKALGPDEMRIYPQLSSFALACNRLRWSQEECGRVSLHGRALERIIPYLQPGRRVLALSWDGSTPGKLAELMSARGFGASRLVVLEALGGPRERIRECKAQAFDLGTVDPLNLIALDLVAEPEARILPLASGLDDDWFEHDGQITKADIRAITLSALRPRAGELLWDVGAGSGSVGLEWCLRNPGNQTIAFEARPERAARIARNGSALGALRIEVAIGTAPASLAGRPAPDAIFIGGGITEPGVFEAAWSALKPGGRLVANVVTLEGEARLAALYATHGGTLRRIGLSHLDAVGNMHGWRAAMPVTQWRVVKP